MLWKPSPTLTGLQTQALPWQESQPAAAQTVQPALAAQEDSVLAGQERQQAEEWLDRAGQVAGLCDAVVE